MIKPIVKLSAKILAISFITMLLRLIPAAPAMAGNNQWTSIGPKGGTILALVMDPIHTNILYAGTSGGGVFKSINSGDSWSQINEGLTIGETYSLAIDPNNPATLYAGVDGDVFKSIDCGNSWNQTNAGLDGYSVKSIIMDPANSSTLYVLKTGGSVYKSINGAASWVLVNSGATPGYVNSLAIDKASVLYAGAYTGVYKSTDGGNSWQQINNSMKYPYFVLSTITIDPNTPATIYAGASNYGIYKSTNAGVTWSAANTGFTYPYPSSNVFAIDPAHSSTIYVGTGWEGIFKSTDSGNSWGPINNGVTANMVSSLIMDPTNTSTIYAGTFGGGVFKSIDGGENWSAKNNGLANTYVTALAIDPKTTSTIYASMRSYDGVFKSTDGGNNWNTANNGLSDGDVWTLAINPIESSILYADNNGVIYKSSDSAASWSQLTYLPYVSSLAIDPYNPSTIYAGTSGSGIYKSIDAGDTWTPANTGSSTNIAVSVFAIDPVTPATVYAGTGGYGVFKSTDGGDTWGAVNSGLTSYALQVSALAVDPAHPSTIYAGTAAGVYKSTNAGGAWNAVNNGLTSNHVNALIIDPMSTTIFAGTWYEGVFKSTDGGNTWNQINSGLTNKNVRSLAINTDNPATLYAGTYGNGVFAWTFPMLPPPSAPIGVTVTSANAQITISWNSVTGATSYNIYYSTTPGVTKATGTKITGVSAPYTLSSLINGTPYYFVVTAVNAYGESVESDQVAAVPNIPTVAYSMTDLAGNWESNGLASGAGAPWWERASATIAADGSFTATTTYLNEPPDSISGVFNISSDGIITLQGNANLQCAMEAGKTVFVCTDTWTSGSPGDVEMKVIVKKASSCTLADLTGDWGFSSFKTPGPYWERGSLTVASDGSFTGSSNNSDNNNLAWSGSFAITPDGIITPTGVNPSRCVMDAGKSVIVCTSTSNSGASGMQIMTKKGPGYLQSDLTGNWRTNDMLAPMAWWGRAFLTINPDGSFSGNLIGSDNDTETLTGTLSIASDGIVTGSSSSLTPSFGCSMESGKTLFACTANGSSGNASFMVAVKRGQTGAPTLAGLAITNGPASVNESGSATYSATAYWSNGSSGIVAPVWSVTPVTHAAINSSTGLLTVMAVPSDQTVTVTASYTSGNVTLIASKTVTIVNQSSTLTLTISGDGAGSVNSNPSAWIACTWPPQNGTCSTTRALSDSFELIATPDDDSVFGGWSGACANSSGNCTVNMSTDRTVTAYFNYVLPARIRGGSGFPSLQSAYDSAANNDIIQAREFEFSENLLLNRGIRVKITGGYDRTFTTNSNNTTLNGIMRIRSGAVAVEKLQIK